MYFIISLVSDTKHTHNQQHATTTDDDKNNRTSHNNHTTLQAMQEQSSLLFLMIWLYQHHLFPLRPSLRSSPTSWCNFSTIRKCANIRSTIEHIASFLHPSLPPSTTRSQLATTLPQSTPAASFHHTSLLHLQRSSSSTRSHHPLLPVKWNLSLFPHHCNNQHLHTSMLASKVGQGGSRTPQCPGVSCCYCHSAPPSPLPVVSVTTTSLPPYSIGEEIINVSFIVVYFSTVSILTILTIFHFRSLVPAAATTMAKVLVTGICAPSPPCLLN